MIPRVTNGAELLCNTLETLGVKHVFGVPGTQNVVLYDALHRSAIRSVLSTHELGASFMANGYYRASGKIAPLITIQGPGFTYALTGLAEALQRLCSGGPHRRAAGSEGRQEVRVSGARPERYRRVSCKARLLHRPG